MNMKHLFIRVLAKLVRPIVVEAYDMRPRVEHRENGIVVFR